jgi:prepilin-type N-terminal cleavage/methylation domain-containing protein
MDTVRARHPAHATRGVSLIECMVAMAIVAIAASMVTMSVQGGLAMQEDALRMTVASTAAESRISELLGKPWDDLSALDQTETAGTIADDDGISFPAAYRGLARRTVVTQRALTVPDFPGLSIPGWDIEVIVTDGAGQDERTLVRLRRFRPQTIEDRLQ